MANTDYARDGISYSDLEREREDYYGKGKRDGATAAVRIAMEHAKGLNPMARHLIQEICREISEKHEVLIPSEF